MQVFYCMQHAHLTDLDQQLAKQFSTFKVRCSCFAEYGFSRKLTQQTDHFSIIRFLKNARMVSNLKQKLMLETIDYILQCNKEFHAGILYS